MPKKNIENVEKDSKKKVTTTKVKKVKDDKKVVNKKSVSSKKVTSKKTTTSKKVSSSKSKEPKNSKEPKEAKRVTLEKPRKTRKTSSKTNTTAKPMLAEYYDLPYSYNETTVKILAQTPTTLFVYWDISDNDRNTLIQKYGENVFYETIPILIVHNTTKNYSFEVEINDFANSWYIRAQEPDCNYIIELGRKIINNSNQYIYIDSSNNIMSPNDHILFEKSNLGNVIFRNVKTQVLSSKDFGSLRFINDIDKLYGNVYDVYNKLYKNGELNELTNPSSGEFMMNK